MPGPRPVAEVILKNLVETEASFGTRSSPAYDRRVSMNGAAHEPPVPERIGRYDVLVPLGRGGMATVYLARAEVVQGVSRDYALKVMHAHLRGDPEWASHLLHEAKIAARIRHPNVVPVVEAGDDPLGLFLVLEYVEGDTLSGLSRALRNQGQALPLRISGRILLDALAGLHAAHELLDESGKPLNLVHRDFSPQNILVGVDGIGRLTDFGIAKAQGSEATATGVLKGKISYMSPEQARGSRVDRRCDVWAAGVIAWELLAGRRLYRNKNDTETLLAIVQQVPPKLREVNPDASPSLEQIVAHALTPNPSERCADARSFGRALELAWREHIGLADGNEVAALVQGAVRETEARRRSKIQQVLASRAGRSDAVIPAHGEQALTPAEAASGDSLVLGEQPDKESATGFQLVTSAHRTHKVAMGAGAALAVVALGALGVIAVNGSTTANSADPLSTNASATEARPSAAVIPEPPPSPTASSVLTTATLLVRANQKLTKLRIGRRSVEVSPPAKEVEVQLEGAEVGIELGLEATGESGKTVAASVGKTQGVVELKFETESRGPRVQPKPKAQPKPTDELAPTPFKKSGGG